MLKEVIRIFEKEYNKPNSKGDKDYFVSKGHIPADGEYIILGETEDGFQELDRITIKMDKKTRTVETTNQYFDFIRSADYMSRYLESNKAVSDKNIHSNNYLTLFVKKENVINGKINNEVLSDYYDVFRNPYKKKYEKSPIRKSYEAAEKKYGVSDTKRIDKIEKWVKENLSSYCGENDKGYLKLFFYYDLEEYRKESGKYILTNIYNSANYNVTIGGKIYGLPNNNMGLNSKKPYLELMDRKNSVPVLLNQDEVLIQKKFFDYLNNLAAEGKTNIYFSEDADKTIQKFDNNGSPHGKFSGYFMRIQKGMEPEIHDFDVISDYNSTIRPVKVNNILKYESEKPGLQYETISSLNKLKEVINKTFFKDMLANNYFTEAKDIKLKDECLKRNILLSRIALFNWFYKGMSQGIWYILKPVCLDLIKGSIFNSYIGRASEQFNLYISLKKYFELRKREDENLDINKFKGKINSPETVGIESDEEYFFAVGQLANYFLTLSKAKVKRHSLSNHILNAKSDEKIKTELHKLFFKYNHDTKNGRRFNNIYSMICDYYPKGKVNIDSLIGGYLHSSLIYEKDEKRNDDENVDKDIDNITNEEAQ